MEEINIYIFKNDTVLFSTSFLFFILASFGMLDCGI